MDTTRELYEILVTTTGSKEALAAVQLASQQATESLRKTQQAAKSAGDSLGSSIAPGASSAARAIKRNTDESRNLGLALNNVQFQIQDFFIQISSGTSAVRALSQQLPQAAAAFSFMPGPIGLAAAGIATFVAVAPVLIDWLISGGKEAITFSDSIAKASESISAFAQSAEIAVAPFTQLSEAYGRFANSLRVSSDYLSEVQFTQILADFGAVADAMPEKIENLIEAVDEYSLALQRVGEIQLQASRGLASQFDVTSALGGLQNYRDALDEAQAALGLTAQQATRLQSELQDLSQASTIGEIATQAGEVLFLLRQWYPDASKLTPEMAEIYTQIFNIQKQAAETATNLSNSRAAATGLSGVLPGINANVINIASNSQRMASGLISAARAYGVFLSGLQPVTGTPNPFGVNSPVGPGAAGSNTEQLRRQREEQRNEFIRQTEADIQSWRDARAALAEAATGGGGSGPSIDEAMQENVDAVEEALDQIIKEYEEAKDRLREQTEEIGRLFTDPMKSAFDSLIDRTKSVSEAFSDMLNDILTDVAKFLVSRQITSLLNLFVGSGFGSSVGGILSTPLAPGAATLSAPTARIGADIAVPTSDVIPAGYQLPQSYYKGLQGSNGMSVVINNNRSEDTDVNVSEKRNADGTLQLDVAITRKIQEAISSGKLDKTMAQSYGIRRKTS